LPRTRVHAEVVAPSEQIVDTIETKLFAKTTVRNRNLPRLSSHTVQHAIDRRNVLFC